MTDNGWVNGWASVAAWLDKRKGVVKLRQRTARELDLGQLYGSN